MLSDDRLIELISASLDDALSPQEAAELETALASSAQARQLSEVLRGDSQALRALPSLQAPPELKRRTLAKLSQQAPSALGRPWQRVALLAASFALVVGIFNSFQAGKEKVNALYLAPRRLVTSAETKGHELRLSSGGTENSHLMVSENLSGRLLKAKSARVHLLCDAGSTPGGKLSVSLHYDFDGDGQVDLRTSPQVLDLDDTDGYQELLFSFGPAEGMSDLRNGKVHLEVACQDGPPLRLKFEPQGARVELPFSGLKLSPS